MSLIDKVLDNQSKCWQTLHDMEDPSKIIVAVDVWIPPPNEVEKIQVISTVWCSLVALFRKKMES